MASGWVAVGVAAELYGRIESNWKRESDRVTMEVTIPADTTATVYVPAKAVSDVTVNGQALKKADHVTFLRIENDRAVVNVGSGNYIITSSKK